MLGVVLAIWVISAQAQPAFEEPNPLNAGDILPADLRQRPFHRIDERVLNDGYMNTYTVHSNFGELTVVSSAFLKIRIEEFKAIDTMRHVEQTETVEGG